MADLYFIRHGETSLNRDNKIRGWKDIPLDEQGKQEAHHLADYFKEHDVVKIYTSDLTRAHDTATVISEAVHAPVFADKNWRPWHLGNWSGESVTKVLPDMLACVKDEAKCPPDGEPFSRFRQRVTKALLDVQREAARSDGECFLIVTHVRNIRMILGILDHGPHSPEANEYILEKDDPIDPGGAVEVAFDHGTWSWDIVEMGEHAPVQSQTVS